MKLLKSRLITSLAIAALICPSYATAKTNTDNGRVPQVDGNVQPTFRPLTVTSNEFSGTEGNHRSVQASERF